MKKIYTIRRRKFAVLFLSAAYLIVLWLTASSSALFLFVFLSLMTALSLDTSNRTAFKKRLAIVLSFIVAYPLYWHLLLGSAIGFFNPYLILHNHGFLIGSFLVYLPLFLVYGFLMRDFHVWIDKAFGRLLIISIVVLLFITVFFLIESVFCISVSAAEKGVDVSAIQSCRVLNMYNPISHYDSKFGIIIGLTMLLNAGTLIFYVMLSVLYIARNFLLRK